MIWSLECYVNRCLLSLQSHQQVTIALLPTSIWIVPWYPRSSYTDASRQLPVTLVTCKRLDSVYFRMKVLLMLGH